ncbi:ATP-binding cassette domain-containing protein, partial [Testudinibacter sp. TR-2022]
MFITSSLSYFCKRNKSKRAIKITNLSFQYDKFSKPLFIDLSFEINNGESVAIVAPSGFGKTTLLKIISGLLQPTKGKVFFNQIDINKEDCSNILAT